MKKTYKAKLSQQSILRLAKEMEELADKIDTNTQHLLTYLAVAGQAEAEKAYGEGVQVLHASRWDEAYITASAPDIYVKEFGAGYATYTDHPLAEEADVPIEPGAWSKQNLMDGVRGGGQFYLSDWMDPGEGYWRHDGQKYQYISPRYGMLRARNYIWDHYAEFAKEVLLR